MFCIWDPQKNVANQRNHGFDLEMASRVFDDPLARTRPDPHPDGDRLLTVGTIGTIGTIGNLTVFVVHTFPEFDPVEGDEIGRIISARRATIRERRAYEEDSE